MGTTNKEGKLIAKQLFSQVLNQPVKKVVISYKACATLDFGEDVVVEIKTRKGVDSFTRGEWCFWLYACAWRLDQAEKSIVASGDSPEKIKANLPRLEGKKLLNIQILNAAFDLLLDFEDEFRLLVFVDTVEDSEPWTFSTKDHIFAAGPGKAWSYKKYD